MPAPRGLLWVICRSIAILLISGFLGAGLMRLAPGFGSSEQELNPQFSATTLEALRREHRVPNLFVFYVHYLTGLLHGDAGYSLTFSQPVGRLIAERAPATLRAVAEGLTFGWLAAVLFAAAAALSGRLTVVLAAITFSGSLLSVPSAVLATICLLARLPPAAAISAVVLPSC